MRQLKLMIVLLVTLLCCNHAWSLPRFVDLNDGTVLDTVSSLRWLKNANCFERQTWDAALSSANTLAAPACGLTDGSAAGDWHLPTIDELKTLVAAPDKYRYGTLNTAGFSNVMDYCYWSASTYPDNASFALSVDMGTGYRNIDGKTNSDHVWPVRAGQHWSLDPLVIFGAADFGTVSVGTTFGHTFTLKNSSTSQISVSSIALSDTDSGQFTLATGGPTPCSSLTSLSLAGGASCTVLVAVKPTNAGSKSAKLTVVSTAGSIDALLTATGSAPLSVTYNGNGNSAGSVPTDSTAYATGQSVTVLGNSGKLVQNGSAFNGWNTAADGSGAGYQPGATFTISADTVLYAKWATAIAPPSGLISWWRGEGDIVDSVGSNTGTSHFSAGIVTATAAENATATATCDSGETIVSYSSIYGSGSQTISCGSCTVGANSCSVTYSNANCTDPAIGTAKNGTLSLTCTSSNYFPDGKVGQAIKFNGSSDYVTQGKTYKGVTSSSANSSFTMEFWAKPTSTISNLPASQTTSGYAGASGQRYAIFPEMQDSTTEAGAGVSVGTNGIMVTEHASDYLPAPLVYPLVDGDMPSDGWLHVAVVYESQTPKLYVNGVLKQTGLSSGRTVYPSSQFGGTSYGFYSGLLDEQHIFNRALTVTEIQNIYNAGSGGVILLPTVTGITPSTGSSLGGTTVTITGTNLTGATAVKFGATDSVNFSVDSDTQATATSPAGVVGQIADVLVTTPGGTSAVSSADQFTYTLQYQAKNQSTTISYTTLAEAISSALAGHEIRAYAGQFDGTFSLVRDIILNGGYNMAFSAKDSLPTTLNGSLTVTGDTARVDSVTVKGVLTIGTGRLTVDKLVVK